MAIQVKTYRRRIHGKLVTVHGYDANRQAVYGDTTNGGTRQVMHSENVDRNTRVGLAAPGTYVQPHIMQGIGGLTSYLYQAAGAHRDLPEYKWRRSQIPKRGAYKIPKNESGNQTANPKNNNKAGDFDAVKL